MATVTVPPDFPFPTEERNFSIPPKFRPLLSPKQFKVFWGGRGSAKTWTFARVLVVMAHHKKLRIGCFRELQASIKDSVYQTLVDQIELLGLTPFYEITQKEIRHRLTKSTFVFKGLRSNIIEIKSMEGLDIAWVEEAQLVSDASWKILIPTIRQGNSEIWISFNPVEEDDPTYKLFVLNPPPNSIVVKVNWYDNPYFSKALNDIRLWMLASDPDAYEHVWNGNCRILSNAIIFRGRYVIDAFEPPVDPPARFFHGLDFGFADDPLCATRSWITETPLVKDDKGKWLSGGQELWIDTAMYGHGVEIDEIPQLLDSVPSFRTWPIKADCSRPETISYIRRKGFNIEGADKWDGSVEDGIAHLKAFSMIHIHQRLKELQQEARLYAYKKDRVSNDVLPIIVDKHNHGWDGLRYSLDGYIQRRGANSVWAKL